MYVPVLGISDQLATSNFDNKRILRDINNDKDLFWNYTFLAEFCKRFKFFTQYLAKILTEEKPKIVRTFIAKLVFFVSCNGL